jgi:hypothetical protein
MSGWAFFQKVGEFFVGGARPNPGGVGIRSLQVLRLQGYEGHGFSRA